MLIENQQAIIAFVVLAPIVVIGLLLLNLAVALTIGVANFFYHLFFG